MESVIIIAGLILALVVVLGMLRAEVLKNVQIEPLKEALKEQNELAKKKDAEFLADADLDNVVGFLNRLRSNETDPD